MAQVMSGRKPWQDVKDSEVDLVSDDLWSLLMHCWDTVPSSRPKAQKLVEDLEKIVTGVETV
jgi:hypothetical protein